MVKVETNDNFPNWIAVFKGLNLVEQFTSKQKAIRLAKKLSRRERQSFFMLNTELVPSGYEVNHGDKR